MDGAREPNGDLVAPEFDQTVRAYSLASRAWRRVCFMPPLLCPECGAAHTCGHAEPEGNRKHAELEGMSVGALGGQVIMVGGVLKTSSSEQVRWPRTAEGGAARRHTHTPPSAALLHTHRRATPSYSSSLKV